MEDGDPIPPLPVSAHRHPPTISVPHFSQFRTRYPILANLKIGFGRGFEVQDVQTGFGYWLGEHSEPHRIARVKVGGWADIVRVDSPAPWRAARLSQTEAARPPPDKARTT